MFRLRQLALLASLTYVTACSNEGGDAGESRFQARGQDGDAGSVSPNETQLDASSEPGNVSVLHDAGATTTPDRQSSTSGPLNDASVGSGVAPNIDGGETSMPEADPTALDAATAGELDAGRADGDGEMTPAADGGGPELDAGVPPALTNLEIQGVRFDVQPAFAPDRLRYAAVAEETLGNLRILAEAGAGLSITIDGQPAESGVPFALPDAQERTTIVVAVSNAAGQSAQYEIQYLPTTFPRLQARTNDPRASGDPLYATFRVNVGVSYAAIVDNFGVPYHYAGHAAPVFDLKKHPNGEISYAVYQEDGYPGAAHVVLDENFVEQRRLVTVGLKDTDFHEFRILPNGNYLMLAYEPAVRDATAYGGSATQGVKDSTFQEVSPAMEVLFQWNSWGQFAYDHSAYAGTNIDYAHVNSIVVDADGNYLVSSRGTSQVAKIDKTTGQIVWRMGGIANEFTFIDDPLQGTCGQHDAHWLPNGNLLVFDNGNPCPPGDATEAVERPSVSRVVEYEVDQEQRTAKLVWQYSRPGIFVTAAGSAQRLANGNTLIGWGNAAAACATEVDSDGNIVFDLTAYRPEPGMITYRALRFASGE